MSQDIRTGGDASVTTIELDRGPDTIAWHPRKHRGLTVSVNSIHCRLRAGGYIDPQPQKRP